MCCLLNHKLPWKILQFKEIILLKSVLQCNSYHSGLSISKIISSNFSSEWKHLPIPGKNEEISFSFQVKSLRHTVHAVTIPASTQQPYLEKTISIQAQTLHKQPMGLQFLKQNRNISRKLPFCMMGYYFLSGVKMKL